MVLNDRFVAQLRVQLSQRAGLAVTSKMFGCPPADLTDEDCRSTAGELGNLITGRVHARMRERSLTSVCGLPVLEDGSRVDPPDDAVGLLQCYALPDAGDFYISITVEDRLALAKAPARPAAAPAKVAGAA
jgi:CheY-specific phosphatase CheX